MFINTKKAIKITADESRETFEANAGWIGEIPKWVEEHWYFKALCKDGSVTAIVSSKDKDIQNALDPKTSSGSAGGEDTELTDLRARAAELKIARANQLGKDKLKAAIAEAEAKQPKPDLLAEMDAAALRQFAGSNNIDLSGIDENASADDIRNAIKAASKE